MPDDPVISPAADPKASGAPGPATSSATPPSDLLANPHVQQLLRSHADALAAKEAASLTIKNELEALKGQFSPLQAKLAEREAAEKKAKEAEMSEIERLTSNLAEAERKRADHESALKVERDAKLALEASMAKREECQRNERDFFSLMAIKAISPNAYELRGLLEDVGKLQYTNEEERGQKIQGVLDAFVAATGRGVQEQGQAQVPAGQSPVGAHIKPCVVVVPTPAGGQRGQAGQLLSDTYTEEQMMQLARSQNPSDRELYQKIRDQRIAVNKAKGIGPLRMKIGA